MSSSLAAALVFGLLVFGVVLGRGMNALTSEHRAALRTTVRDAVARAWPTDRQKRSELTPYSRAGDSLLEALAALSPETALQSDLKAKGESLALELGERRALLRAQASSVVSTPVVFIVVAWLFVILFGFSLISPPGPVPATALVISAAAVSAAIFLILELYHPFDGAIRISNRPLLDAVTAVAP